ncbi:hypothetical protein [Bacillus thuringiensis]|uniref:hypothetical protein n=1 Tax=Bacillus thuringiensis TaxID=1428 RepID=UPI0021D650B3|nr:hypothetical protein [Bacillus thuringiensis]MCU7667360.1 hypothetical protein [Bacillus thuringiensis]
MKRQKLVAKGETAIELLQEISDPNRFEKAEKLYKEALALRENKHKKNKLI